jgi:hypothetical protein
LEVIDMLCDALATFPAYKLMEIDLDAIPEWKVFDDDVYCNEWNDLI